MPKDENILEQKNTVKPTATKVTLKDLSIDNLTPEQAEDKAHKVMSIIDTEGEDSFADAFTKGVMRNRILRDYRGMESELENRINQQKAFLASQNITNLPADTNDFTLESVQSMDSFVEGLRAERPDLAPSLKTSKDLLFDIRADLINSERKHAGTLTEITAQLASDTYSFFANPMDIPKKIFGTAVSEVAGTGAGVAIGAGAISNAVGSFALAPAVSASSSEALKFLASRENEARDVLKLEHTSLLDDLKVIIPTSIAFATGIGIASSLGVGAISYVAYKAISRLTKTTKLTKVAKATAQELEKPLLHAKVSEPLTKLKFPEARSFVYENLMHAGDIIDNADPAIARLNMSNIQHKTYESLVDEDRIVIASLLGREDLHITPDDFLTAKQKLSEEIPFTQESLDLANDIVKKFSDEFSVGVPPEERMIPFDVVAESIINETDSRIAGFRVREFNYASTPYDKLNDADKIVLAKVLNKNQLDISEADFAQAKIIAQERETSYVKGLTNKIYLDENLLRAQKDIKNRSWLSNVANNVKNKINVARSNLPGWYVDRRQFSAEQFLKKRGGEFAENTDFNKEFLDQARALGFTNIKSGQSISAGDMSQAFVGDVSPKRARAMFDFANDYNNELNEQNIKTIAKSLVGFKKNSLRALNIYRNSRTHVVAKTKSNLNYYLKDVLDSLPGHKNTITGEITMSPEVRDNIYREIAGTRTGDESARKSAYAIMNSFFPAIRAEYGSVGMLIRPMSDWLPVNVNPVKVKNFTREDFIEKVVPLLDFERIAKATAKEEAGELTGNELIDQVEKALSKGATDSASSDVLEKALGLVTGKKKIVEKAEKEFKPEEFVGNLYDRYIVKLGSSGNIRSEINSPLDEIIKKQLFFVDGDAWIEFHKEFADSLEIPHVLGDLVNKTANATANFQLFGAVNNGDKLIDFMKSEEMQEIYRYDAKELNALDKIGEHMGARRSTELGKVLESVRTVNSLLSTVKLGRTQVVDLLTSKPTLAMQLMLNGENAFTATKKSWGLGVNKISKSDAKDMRVLMNESFSSFRGDLSDSATVGSNLFFRITGANKVQEHNIKLFYSMQGRDLYSRKDLEWKELSPHLKNTFTKKEWNLLRKSPDAVHTIDGVSYLSPTKLADSYMFKNVDAESQRFANSMASKYVRRLNEGVLMGDELSKEGASLGLRYGKSTAEDIAKILTTGYTNFSTIAYQAYHTTYANIYALLLEKRYGDAAFTIAHMLAMGSVVNEITNISAERTQTPEERMKSVLDISGLGDFYVSKLFNDFAFHPKDRTLWDTYSPATKLGFEVGMGASSLASALFDAVINDKASLNQKLSDSARHARNATQIMFPRNIPVPVAGKLLSDFMPDLIIKTFDPYAYEFFENRERRKISGVEDVDRAIARESKESQRLRNNAGIREVPAKVSVKVKEVELEKRKAINSSLREETKALSRTKSDSERRLIKSRYESKIKAITRKYNTKKKMVGRNN